MEINEILVTGSKNVDLGWEEVLVMPIGDLQLGSDGVDLDRFKKHIAWGIKHNAMFIGMGDAIDLMSPSNRAKWKSAAMYDSVQMAMADRAEKLTDDFLKLVKGTEGRWLGIHHGHHYFEFEDGTTSDTRIAKALKAPFLGSCAFTRLKFKPKTNHRSVTCTIWSHHGSGNGIAPHAPLNKLYHVMQSFEADIFLLGHMTKKPVVKMPRIYMGDNPPYRLVNKNKVLAGTGGFTKGYEQGSKHYSGAYAEGSYVEKGMMVPVSLGGIVLKIRPVYSSNGQPDRVDIAVEV